MELDSHKGLGNANLALSSFVACQHPAESCGHNGLPLTPNSIGILGQAEVLKSLHHPHLCQYLGFQRGQHDRIVCISEHFGPNLKEFSVNQPSELMSVAHHVLSALDFLQQNEMTVMNLSASNIVFDGDKWKLYNYGMSHMTDYGLLVGFPLFDPRSVAPEIIQSFPSESSNDSKWTEDDTETDSISHILPARKAPFKSSVAVWTLGMILLAKAIGLKCEQEFWPSLKVSQVLRKVLSLVHCQDMMGRLSREFDCESTLKSCPEDVKALIAACLDPNPETRPTPGNLLKSLGFSTPSNLIDMRAFPTIRLRCENLSLDSIKSTPDDADTENPLSSLSLREIYYLWFLAGGDIMSELRKNGLMASMPPILALPKVVVIEGHPLGVVKERCSLYDPINMVLPMSQLLNCLADLTAEDAYPLINGSKSSGDEMATMPLAIKERDVKYQFKRTVLFRRLLQGYPFTRHNLWNEARIDTLPLYRSLIWASLLGVEHDVKAAYEAIDKETPTPTDRQIEVDIPRCHQYNSLLASAEGHRKFKRVLKAWVVTNPQYVYWQGLDSLCAPFLYLNFNNEALAFACLQAFIPKYLLGMFRQDNAEVIQEYLAKFSHLQAFHDPILFNHLDTIGFIPDLYAIPWVLTMFAHVFPLQSIFHLWDKLLLGNESFPLCVALAILQQLRARLMDSEFNDCILLFSDLPAIDIEDCVSESIRIFCSTPKSLTYRKCGKAASAMPNGGGGDVERNLSLGSVTVEMQKGDRVPRISGEELLMLLGLRAMRDDSDGHFVQPQKPKAVSIDVRPKAEYKMGSLPDSINVPFAGAFDADGKLQAKYDVLEAAKQKKSKVICVVGSGNNEHARQFAESLLSENYHRVCYLHNGIEIFRSLNILIVPDLN